MCSICSRFVYHLPSCWLGVCGSCCTSDPFDTFHYLCRLPCVQSYLNINTCVCVLCTCASTSAPGQTNRTSVSALSHAFVRVGRQTQLFVRGCIIVQQMEVNKTCYCCCFALSLCCALVLGGWASGWQLTCYRCSRGLVVSDGVVVPC